LVARREESIITEHRDVPAMRDGDALCSTAFVGARSFTLELPLAAAIEIGRASDADIQVVSGGVSRAHARLAVNGVEATLTDLGSRNGTFVNRTRVTGAQIVRHGDEISIGDGRIVLYRKSALPAGVVPLLVRAALLERLDMEVAAGRRPSLFVIQLPERWYEIETACELVEKLSGTAIAGTYNDHIVAFAVNAPPAEARTVLAACTRTLRHAGVDTSAGFAHESSGGAEDLLDAALHALLRAQDDDAETAEAPIVGDASMMKLYEEARRIAKTPITVLLVGETGSGKEVFARAIHSASGRAGPLVCVNTAALPEQLLESELFGHEKGAFSGAAGAKAGLIEQASGGTLFLDEIGELAMPMQAKLLRVLEDRVVRRVGATAERRIDVRVIAATNADLEEAVREKHFRRDLLFRLNACTLHIPPLRERPTEIRRLAEVFLTRAAATMGAPLLRFAPGALDVLERHPWPGNVRELRNVVERAAALCAGSGEPIGVAHLPKSVGDGARGLATLPALAGPGSEAGDEGDVRDSVRDYERRRIVEALQKCGGNQTQAAELLGLPRRTLAYKMQRLGIRAK
jgi:DNA-binding NtrC family response regulator/pSer/pThr/pTyr-binding forkhead associated (FHA) protein